MSDASWKFNPLKPSNITSSTLNRLPRAGQCLTLKPSVLTHRMTECVPWLVPCLTRGAKRGKPTGTRGAWGRAGNEADLRPPPSLPAWLGWPHPGPQLSTPALCDPLATEQPGELKKNNSDHVPPLFTTFQRLPTALRVNSELSTRALLAWLLPPPPVSPGPSTSHTAPPTRVPGCSRARELQLLSPHAAITEAQML